jgi:hypothetical protein
MILIELGKPTYTAANVDALRDASDAWLKRADATRDPSLTDEQKLSRFLAVVSALNDSGGLGNAGNRSEAIACAREVGITLVLPG